MDLVNIKETNLHKTIDDLISKHKDNHYVYGRLVNYIENLLPIALDNAVELNKQREARRNTLTANKDEFTARFLQKNYYYYSPSTELFLHYDGLHFVIRDEDDIYHQVLSMISSEKCLSDWRNKVNKNIIKRIKERSPLKAIPESETIQFVINTLCPSIFKTRNHVKYFLAIVGECLLKKKPLDLIDSTAIDVIPSQMFQEIIYIFPPALKELIREIGNQCYTFFGVPNIFTNIKFKYYEHNYNNCRLISINQKKIEIPPMLTKHMLDFLCVAAHYHVRYGSADNFLHRCNDTRIVDHALFLSKNNQESIVNKFIEKSLTSSLNAVINTKNMLFIWKKFLDERNIPNIIFYETLKTILKKKLNYDETSDCFTGITSIHLPIVTLFMRFWEETIVLTDHNTDVIYADITDTCELEIDEICVIFKHWSNNLKSINEGLVIELIQHFYPDMVIENNKYILHVRCKLWDKYAEVVNSLNLFKMQYMDMNVDKNVDTNVDTNVDKNMDDIDVYAFYCTQQSKNKYNLLVSKRYYEKTATDTILNEIDLAFP